MFEINEHGVILNPKRITLFSHNCFKAEITYAHDENNRWYGAPNFQTNLMGYSSPVMFMHKYFNSENECIEHYLNVLRSSAEKELKENSRYSKMYNAIMNYTLEKQLALF